MNERFSEACLRCAGLAARALGWTPETFWNATPSEMLAALAPPLPANTPPSRDEIARMIERDAHE